MRGAPSRRFFDAPLGCGLLLTLTAWSNPANAFGPAASAPSTRIYGGEVAKTCQFPTTAGGIKKCTATLIHPRVVISAAHCKPLGTVFFGEYRKKPAFTRKTKWCELTSMRTSDAQICVLEEPVEDLPLAPIIQGCESDKIKVGAKVLLSGFGLDETDPANADDSYKNEKRWVETEIVRVTKDALHIGKNGKGGCNGDSGGPAFLQMDDGTWRTLGATHAGAGGESHPNCATGVWKRADTLLPWYKEQLAKHNESDINLTPCFDDAGNWKPSKDCGGYSKDLKGPFGAWDNHCGEGMPTVKYSATCGQPFKPDGDDDQDSNGEEDQSNNTEDSEGNSKDESNDKPGPAFEISSPKEDQVFASGQAVKVKVKTKSDIASIAIKLDGSELDSLEQAPYEWTLDELEDGKHQIVIEATDNNKQSSEQTRNFVVGDSPESSPKDPESAGTPDPSNPKDPEQKEPTPEQSPNDKGGCQLSERAPWSFGLLCVLAFGWTRRRRPSPSQSN